MAEGMRQIEDRALRQRAGGKYLDRIDVRFRRNEAINLGPMINAAVGEREAALATSLDAT